MRRFSAAARAAILLSLAATLAACGIGESLFSKPQPVNCPAVNMLADTARLIQFRGPGTDLTDVAFEAEVGGVEVRCEFNKARTEVTVTTVLALIGTRGPATAGAATLEIPFYVAVVDKAQNILAKETFGSAMEFPQGRRRAGVSEEITQKIPLSAERRPGDIEVLVGLQLSPQQLEYNRKVKPR